MANVAANIAAALHAQGTPSLVSLVELQTVAGDLICVADMPLAAPSAILAIAGSGSGPIFPRLSVPGLAPLPSGTVAFQPWLLDPPQWSFTGTLTTQTATATIQNASGDSVQRDNSLLFNEEELWGAIFIYRLWHPGLETALITVTGNVSDAEVEDTSMQLTLRDFGNWSEIQAPDCKIDVNCGVTFGSEACGSTSPTPCQNTFGTCTQRNRFKGFISQWSTQSTTGPTSGVGLAQPVPTIQTILRRQA